MHLKKKKDSVIQTSLTLEDPLVFDTTAVSIVICL